MPNLGDLISRVRIAAQDNAARDSFGAALTAGATALTLSSGELVPKGTVLDTEKFEALLVTAKSSTTAGTVARKHYGTTEASHSNGDPIWVSPRFLFAQYREAINNALRALSLMFGLETWDSGETFGSKTRLIKVPAAATRVFAVAYQPKNRTDLLSVPFTFLPSAPTALASTGKAIQLPGFNPATGTVYIGYEKAWPTLTNLTDNLDSGYPSHGEDAIVLGALSYLQDDEAFRRVAFDAAHSQRGAGSSESREVDQASRENLNRFLLRRQELGAMHRQHHTTWIKG